MELTAVALNNGNGFVDDEGWLIDYPGGSENGMSWVETGELNEGYGTEYFYAYGENWCQDNQNFVFFDLGPVDQTDLNRNTQIAYKVDRGSKTPSTWNVTISYAQTGQVLYNEQATGVTMTPNTVTEGQELQGTNGAQAPLAFFSYNAAYHGLIKTYWTTVGKVAAGQPPNAGWWPDSSPVQTYGSGIGGLFFTDCC